MKYKNINVVDVNYENINPIVLEIILNIVEEIKLEGKTYIYITESMMEIPISFDKNEIVDGVIYSVRSLNKLKTFMDLYTKTFITDYKFDNYITVTVDDKMDNVMNTIVFNTKKDCFMIKLGYSKKLENKIDYKQLYKRIKNL